MLRELANGADGAVTDQATNVASKPRPVITVLYGPECLCDAEVAREPSPVQFPNEKIPSGTGGDAETIVEEKEPRFYPVFVKEGR